MKRILLALGAAAIATCAFAQDPQEPGPGRQQEQRGCIQCHSLRLVDSQRLTPAAWEKEVNKMIGWGAVVSDRQTLVEYLSRQYGVDKPAPPRVLTANGTAKPAATPSSK